MTDKNPLARRELLRRSAIIGAVAGSPTVLAACATGGGGGGGEEQQDKPLNKGKVDPKNPFDVDPDKPLDVVIFKGGFSDEYAKYHEKMYQEKFGTKPKHTGTREITGTQQTRFVNGNPPDVIDNSGAQAMDYIALIEQGQIKEISELLQAPSFDDPSVKVEDTLISGALQAATHEGKVWGIPYALNINGLWHDRALFEDNGWEFPKTWDELMKLGEKIKAKGISPWIYQGQYPAYMVTVFNAMVQKRGGNAVMQRVDNLEEGAWKQEAIMEVLQALYELKEREFIMRGTAGLTHIQAQNAWAKGKAAVIPCGSWLKSEIGSAIPEGFEMAVTPTPSLGQDDKMPYESAPFLAGEVFSVPSQAKNVAGGLEYLRIMLSEEGAQKFAELTYTLTIVDGAHDNQELDSVLQSSLGVVDTAQDAPHLDQLKYQTWYDKFGKFVESKMGQMLTGGLDPKGFVEIVQKEADKTKKDPKIEKFTR